jgi:hypothetical protein
MRSFVRSDIDCLQPATNASQGGCEPLQAMLFQIRSPSGVHPESIRSPWLGSRWRVKEPNPVRVRMIGDLASARAAFRVCTPDEYRPPWNQALRQGLP